MNKNNDNDPVYIKFLGMKFHYDFEVFLAIAAIVAVVVVIVKTLFLLLK
ncbi:hypothetical protein [Lactococcus formosensis]|nr:hypothetical protein [Lactococcus formosensis]